MPIESSQSIGQARPIGAIDARIARQASGEASHSPAKSVPATLVATSAALDPGQAPIDADRVTEVRKAVEKGTYPLVPARVADAIIAAGLLLRKPQ